MRFAALLEEACLLLDPLRPQLNPLPPEYALARGSALELRGNFWWVPERGELRGVYIQGPKAEIVNLFFFPDRARDLPVYALEFVELGGRPVVGVLDAPWLAGDTPGASRVKQILSDTRQAFIDLARREEMPEWYTATRSGLDFFLRPRDGAELERLAAAHRQLWRQLGGLLLENPALPPGQSADHQQRLRAYKDHHCRHSPGLSLLRKQFGEVWTRNFLHYYLFG